MKKLFRPFLMVATVAALFTVNSCTKTCDPGYEGSDCKTEVRAKFLSAGATVKEKKNGGSEYSYSSTIIKVSSDVQKVALTKVANGFFNTNVTATVDGNALTITEQDPDGDGYKISGTGSVSGTTLILTFSITGKDGSGNTVTDNYSGTWTL
jgi:hypothetical protein